MSQRSAETFRVVFFTVLLLSPLACARAYAQGDACLECHQEDLDSSRAKSVHPPYTDEECDSCHEDHGSSNILVLIKDGNELCADCHDFEGGELAKSHGGIPGVGALCRGCHNPHFSSRGRLLRADLHRPVLEGKCRSCHRKEGRLLLPRLDLLCQICHPRAGFQGTSVHKPVRDGECLTCHDPHGSAESSLLTIPYSEERWITKGERDYALCVECHDAASLTESVPKSKTGFRNETENLHLLHIGEKESAPLATARSSAINCHNCHDPHAAQEEHLVRRELDCGGVLCLKLNYRVTDGGGECRSGCHGLQSYSHTAGEGEAPDSVIQPDPSPER